MKRKKVPITTNVKGKIREINLHPKQDFLLPLFELVINSIDAIEERFGNINKGRIEIEINRDIQGEIFEKSGIKPIVSYIVKDNGIGFTEKNYNSFTRLYSDYKIEKGGKGVGRFTVVSALSKLFYTSVYKENGEIKIRSIEFDESGVFEIEPSNAINPEIGTIATTGKYKEQFIKYTAISSEEFCKNLIYYLLPYYLKKQIPEIIIKDNGQTLYLKDYINLINYEEVKLKLKNIDFTYYIIRRGDNNTNHKVFLCANNRVVGKSYNIKNWLPDLKGKIWEQDKTEHKFWINIYIMSEFLDKKVNEQRTGFHLNENNEEDELYKELTLKEIKEKAIEIFKDKFSYIIDYYDQKRNEIINSISKEIEILPYQNYLNDPEFKKEITDIGVEDLDKNTLRERLVRYKLRKEEKLDKHLQLAIQQLEKNDIDDYNKFYEELNTIINEDYETRKTDLINYMVRRKTVIKLFGKFLKYKDLDKKDYPQEKKIHNLIFPKYKSTQTIDFEDHNLWLIDERLSFKTFIKSEFTHTDKKRSDIVIFGNKLIYGDKDERDNITDIIIIEFKRPRRKEDIDNVFNQIKGYIKNFERNKIIQLDDGDELNIKDNVNYTVYIIMDVDRKSYYENVDFFNLSPYGTYTLRNKNLYVEIIPYNVLLKNAEIRHKIFFEKLGIDNI